MKRTEDMSDYGDRSDSASLYRDGVGMMVLNRHDRVFVARRIDIPSNYWQMPQGGVEAYESPRASALRELEEEIGTRKVRFLCESQSWLSYDFPEELAGKLWNGTYRGQRQKWFALRFLGADQEINLQTNHPEFVEWKWVTPSQLPDLIVPFKRELYLQILREFSSLLVLDGANSTTK